MRGFRFFLLLCLLPGCSVYRASSNDGVSLEDLLGCDTKDSFLSQGMKVVGGCQCKDGKYIETYKSVESASGLHYVRAVGHGVLDVVTLGLWELAGTPIEGAMCNNKASIIVKAVYKDRESSKAEHVDIYRNGRKVHCRPISSNSTCAQ